MTSNRIFLLTSIVTAVAIAAVVVTMHPWQTLNDKGGTADIGGPFTLTDQDGTRVIVSGQDLVTDGERVVAVATAGTGGTN